MTRPARVVVSYSHKDEQLRQQLVSALSPAVRAGEIDLWSDHCIAAGQDIDSEILAQLKEADGVILLVSHDFVASDYCFKKELEIALERHKNGRSVVLPIIVRPTDFESLPFSRIKALPNDGKAVTTWANSDEAWLSVVRGVREAIARIRNSSVEPSVFKSKKLKECLAENFEELQLRFNEPDRYNDGGTGLRPLDALIGGIRGGEMMLLAGRPGSGFQELTNSILSFLAVKWKRRIIVLSQRLSAPRYANRLLCTMGFVSIAALNHGQLDDDEWSRVAHSIRILKDADVTFDDLAIRSIGDLKQKLVAAKRDGCDVLILDGLEYLSNGSHSDERAMVLELRDFCRESRVAVVCTLSLWSKIDERAYRRPLVSDLDAWGSLEQACDKIIFSFRQDVYDLLGQDYGQISNFSAIVARNIEGTLGEAELRLHTFSGAVSYPREDEL